MHKYITLDKQQESATAEIHSLSHDGRGIATINNKTMFVYGALPHEKITYHMTHKHRRYNEAQIIDVLEASTERATPPCKHFGICGGCTLQHMNMEAQIALKQQTLLDQLEHFGRVKPLTIITPLSAETIGYRRKARLGVRFVIKKNKVLVGFREKSSRYLADLEKCVVLHPAIGERLNELSLLISTLDQYREIPQIEVAMGDTDIALIFRHLEPFTSADLEKLAIFGNTYHFHIYLQPNAPAPIQKLYPADNIHRLSYTLPDHQVKLFFHPLDFTQINLEMNRLMVKQALHLLDLQNTDSVLDLFCGIGNFTLPIAHYAKHVTGIEGSLDMVERAVENARFNGIQNIAFETANLESPAPQASSWLQKSYDKVLLDPPRVGIKAMLPYFNQLNAKRLVYVSCNPATLARDAGELVHQYGYQLTHAGMMNMFPHTSHIEAMAVFDQP